LIFLNLLCGTAFCKDAGSPTFVLGLNLGGGSSYIMGGGFLGYQGWRNIYFGAELFSDEVFALEWGPDKYDPGWRGFFGPG